MYVAQRYNSTVDAYKRSVEEEALVMEEKHLVLMWLGDRLIALNTAVEEHALQLRKYVQDVYKIEDDILQELVLHGSSADGEVEISRDEDEEQGDDMEVNITHTTYQMAPPLDQGST